jgi:hypothetical protein
MPEVSPERQRLAAAIAKVDEWERYIAHAREVGLANADAAATALGNDLVAAEGALKDAEDRRNSARSALKRALGHEVGPSPETARRDLEVARSAWAEAWRQRELVKEEIERLERNELVFAHAARREAVAAVIRCEGIVDRLIAERDELLLRANSIRNALLVLAFAMPPGKNVGWDATRHPASFPPDISVSAAYAAWVKLLEVDAAALPDLPPEPAPQREAAAA